MSNGPLQGEGIIIEEADLSEFLIGFRVQVRQLDLGDFVCLVDSKDHGSRPVDAGCVNGEDALVELLVPQVLLARDGVVGLEL